MLFILVIGIWLFIFIYFKCYLSLFFTTCIIDTQSIVAISRSQTSVRALLPSMFYTHKKFDLATRASSTEEITDIVQSYTIVQTYIGVKTNIMFVKVC